MDEDRVCDTCKYYNVMEGTCSAHEYEYHHGYDEGCDDWKYWEEIGGV